MVIYLKFVAIYRVGCSPTPKLASQPRTHHVTDREEIADRPVIIITIS